MNRKLVLFLAVLLIPLITQAQSAFMDHFNGGFDSNIWDVRNGSNGSPFGCAFVPWTIESHSHGITLLSLPGACSELRTKSLYSYGRVEGSLKTGNTPGTVASIFTYTSWWDVPGRAWQEIDIEFLPTLGNVVHTNVIYQPHNGRYESWEEDIDLGQFGLHIQQDMVTIGFNWTNTRIDWYLYDAWGNHRVIRTLHRHNGNGPVAANQIPSYAWPVDPTRIMINHWHGDNSQSGLYFPGHYNNGDAWAYYDYLQYTPAGSGSSSSSSSSSSSTPAFSQLVQAESYAYMYGVQTEPTSDVGGGLNVGWIDAGDWMAYTNVTFPGSGNYRVEYRVASLNGGGRLSLDLNGGSVLLGELNVPGTGGWQNWTTVSHVVHIPAGTHNVGIFAPQGGWNINWFRITRL